MNPKNNYQQFTSRNSNEIAALISAFNELNSLDQFCLYLDSNGWEIFDQKVCVAVIRHKYRHVQQVTKEIRQLTRDLIMVGSEYHFPHPRQYKVAVHEKHLKNIYGEKGFNILFPNYERRTKKKDLADCD